MQNTGVQGPYRPSGGAIAIIAFGAAVLGLGLWMLVGLLPESIEQGDEERTIGLGAVGGAFSFLGALTIGLVVWADRARGLAKQLKTLHPDAPWMWKPDWASGRIEGSNRFLAIGISLFALVWNAVSWPMVPFLLEEIEGGDDRGWVGLVFPLVGLGIAWMAVEAVRRKRKFGVSQLELITLPGWIGGDFEARLHTRTYFDAPEGFGVLLKCEERHTSEASGTSKTSGGSSTTYVTLYEGRMSVGPERFERSARGGRVPIRFSIPSDCRPTEDLDARISVHWTLGIHARTEGIDFDTSFEIPIYQRRADSGAT